MSAIQRPLQLYIYRVCMHTCVYVCVCVCLRTRVYTCVCKLVCIGRTYGKDSSWGQNVHKGSRTKVHSGLGLAGITFKYGTCC